MTTDPTTGIEPTAHAGQRMSMSDRVGLVVKDAAPGLVLSVLVASLAVLVSLLGSAGVQRVATTSLTLLVVVVGLYSFSGLSGILSFGHISFMGIGAYVSALLTIPIDFKQTHLPNLPEVLSFVGEIELGLFPAVLGAVVVTSILAFLVGIPLVRLDGMQAALATVALIVIANTIIRQWDSVTRGTSTLLGIPRVTTLWIALAGAVLTLLIVSLFQGSTWGLLLRATREDLPAARALGISALRLRLAAFVLSAALCAFGGALWAHQLGSLAPSMFFWQITFLTVAMLIIGGMRSLTGAALGVVVVSMLSEILRRLQDGPGVLPKLPSGVSELALAAILILILVSRPSGLAGGRELEVPQRLLPSGEGDEQKAKHAE